MTRRKNDPLEECTMEKICLCCLCFWCCVPVYYGDSSGGGCGCCGDEDADRSVKKRTSKKRKRNFDPASDLGLSYHDFQVNINFHFLLFMMQMCEVRCLVLGSMNI